MVTPVPRFDPLDLSERMFAGQISVYDRHPVGRMTNELAEVAERTAWVESLANVAVFDTDDGICTIDTGGFLLAEKVHGEIRAWSDARFNTGVYTHGHIDHVMGTPVFEAYNESHGHPAARVVGHVGVAPRFERYRRTLGYNSVINQRQFQIPGLQWPDKYRVPDVSFTERLTLEVGGLRLELHHARGETDDHTWVWVPERNVLCTGDLFIWAVPNAGNPQKVQRYAGEWAVALRQMALLGAELLLPGHGLPIAGGDRVRAALDDTATLLESLEGQTLDLMNQGATLDEVLHTVRAPTHLADRPYLQPVYDEPEFIVRNIWRLYGGWYDGNPASLKPAPDASVAAELASLAGGPMALADRAGVLADEGDFRLACHLVELAHRAAPDDGAVHGRRRDVYARRVDHETSTMARGVFSWAAAESGERADVAPES